MYDEYFDYNAAIEKLAKGRPNELVAMGKQGMMPGFERPPRAAKRVMAKLDDAIQWQEVFRDASDGFDLEQVEKASNKIAAYRRVYGRLTGGKAEMREIGRIKEQKDAP